MSYYLGRELCLIWVLLRVFGTLFLLLVVNKIVASEKLNVAKVAKILKYMLIKAQHAKSPFFHFQQGALRALWALRGLWHPTEGAFNPLYIPSK